MPFVRLLALVGALLFLGSSPQRDFVCFHTRHPGSLVDHFEDGLALLQCPAAKNGISTPRPAPVPVG